MNEAIRTVWYYKTGKSFFLIPETFEHPTGIDQLEDMSGNTIKTDIQLLQSYICTQQQAQQHLENQWNESVENSKRAWSQLYHLTELSGRGYNMNKLKKSLLDGLEQQGPGVAQAFEQGKTAVEELLKAVEAGDPASPEDEKNVFKHIFKQMPGLSALMSEEELNKAAENPEAWAKKLQEQFITPAEKERLKEKEDKLAKEIRESIAEGLRKVGVKPAEDFDKNK